MVVTVKVGATVKVAYELSKAAATNLELLAALSRTESNLDNSAYDMLIDFGKEVRPEWPMTGLACPNPQATMGALHVVLRATSFQEGLTENCMVGGDTCSRATIIGVVLGAAFGVPAKLKEKLKVPDLMPFLS